MCGRAQIFFLIPDGCKSDRNATRPLFRDSILEGDFAEKRCWQSNTSRMAIEYQSNTSRILIRHQKDGIRTYIELHWRTRRLPMDTQGAAKEHPRKYIKTSKKLGKTTEKSAFEYLKMTFKPSGNLFPSLY